MVSVIDNLLELFLKNKKTENGRVGTWNEKKKKKKGNTYSTYVYSTYYSIRIVLYKRA